MILPLKLILSALTERIVGPATKSSNQVELYDVSTFWIPKVFRVIRCFEYFIKNSLNILSDNGGYIIMISRSIAS